MNYEISDALCGYRQYSSKNPFCNNPEYDMHSGPNTGFCKNYHNKIRRPEG